MSNSRPTWAEYVLNKRTYEGKENPKTLANKKPSEKHGSSDGLCKKITGLSLPRNH